MYTTERRSKKGGGQGEAVETRISFDEDGDMHGGGSSAVEEARRRVASRRREGDEGRETTFAHYYSELPSTETPRLIFTAV
jgi:hypothetical protein